MVNLSSTQVEPLLVVLAGPTAVGKTQVSISLAKHYQTAIVSCDARQFYRELSIGTAKPTQEEQDGVPHYFIDSHSIHELYGAGDFERDALSILESLFRVHPVVFLVGGSGLFIKALLEGFDDMPSILPEHRHYWMQRLAAEGLPALVEILKNVDPEYAQKVDLANTQRVVRALEVYAQTGRPISSFYGKAKKKRPFRVLKIALDRPRPELYDRINQRVEIMFSQGLLEEAAQVKEFAHVNALQTVGYKEIFACWRGEVAEKDLPELIAQNTRRFAKRQLTWFRHQDVFHWFHPDQEMEMKRLIDDQLKENVEY